MRLLIGDSMNENKYISRWLEDIYCDGNIMCQDTGN